MILSFTRATTCAFLLAKDAPDMNRYRERHGKVRRLANNSYDLIKAKSVLRHEAERRPCSSDIGLRSSWLRAYL
jgi:hypothetical protein